MSSKDELVFKIEFFPSQPNDNWSEKRKAKWAANRMYYSCNMPKGKIDVAHYIADQEKVAHPIKDLLRDHAGRRLGMDYLSYRLPTTSEEQRIENYLPQFNTLGVFGLNGALTKTEYEEWITGAQKTDSSIWYGVISLPIWLSPYVGYEDMERLIITLFSDLLRWSRFNTNNIALFCAMHENTEHAHVHLAFYEKNPNYIDKNGKLTFRKKSLLPKQEIEKFRIDAKNYFIKDLRDLSNYRNAILRRLPTYVPTKKDLYIDLIELEDKLPKDANLRYNGENISLYCKDIDSIVLRLFQSSGRETLNVYHKMFSDISKRSKALVDMDAQKKFVKRSIAYYKSRLGNVVLGMVRQYRTHLKLARWSNPKTDRQYKARARCSREVGMEVITRTLELIESGVIQTSFLSYLEHII